MTSRILDISDFQLLNYYLDSNPTLEQVEKIIFRDEKRPSGHQNARLEAILKVVNASLAYLEREPIQLFNNESSQECIDLYSRKWKIYTQFSGGMVFWLKKFSLNQPLYTELKKHDLACMYRAGNLFYSHQLGYLKSTANLDKMNTLRKRAEVWLKQQTVATTKILNKTQVEQLRKAAKYERWLDFLLNQPQLKEGYSELEEEFFNWALRDYCSVSWFIKYPAMQHAIKEALLPNHIGRRRAHDGSGFRAYHKNEDKNKNIHLKIPTLPVKKASEPINLADPHAHIYFDQRVTTVEKCFAESSQRNNREVDFNVTAKGLSDCHPVKGYLDPKTQQYIFPKLTKGNWLKMIQEHLLADEMSEKMLVKGFPQKVAEQISQSTLFFELCATSKYATSSALDCHGYLAIYEKVEDRWKIVEIGLYASVFHQNLWDAIYKFAQPLPGVLSYLDPNGELTQRQHSGIVSIPPNLEVAHSLLGKIYDDFIEKEKTFLFASDQNCTAPWVHLLNDPSLGDQAIPLDVCRVKVGDARIGVVPLVDRFLSLVGRCSLCVQKYLILGLSNLLGGWRTRIVKIGDQIRTFSLNRYYQEEYIKNNGQLYAWVPSMVAKSNRSRSWWSNTDRFHINENSK